MPVRSSEGPPTAIFLSPHFDDIALSCGGMASRLSRTGARCIGVTVCAAPSAPGEPVSPFAQMQHSRWENASGSDIASINEVRRQEEQSALKLLGLEPVWLDVPDAIYRRGSTGEHLYASEDALFGRVAPEERQVLVPRITEEIRRVARESGAIGRVRVFAPLGVGNHVDHQLVFRAARRLPPRFGVLFYEDYPYVSRPGTLQARMDDLQLPVQPRVVLLTEQIGLKIAAISRYKSQLEVLFGSSEAVAGQVRSYGHSVAGREGQYAERFWYSPPAYVLNG
ncbi:MAG TPA: PIG-L family deacetylase [Chloroflexia bacterium]|nr:PIG-L family deacetylase [Chloroflexia bacterium]